MQLAHLLHGFQDAAGLKVAFARPTPCSVSSAEMVISSDGMSGEWSRVLSPREREVALLVAQGLANKEIARELGLSHGTVKLHVHNIFLKLRARNFFEPGMRKRYVLINLVSSNQATENAEWS
jgi:DNA-binding NarL/FixJ family response regulator